MVFKNFIVENWMVTGLGLSGNELVLFAILWKASKRGASEVVCDYTNISAAMGVTIPTMYNAAKKLTDKGCIVVPRKGVYKIVDNLNLS